MFSHRNIMNIATLRRFLTGRLTFLLITSFIGSKQHSDTIPVLDVRSFRRSVGVVHYHKVLEKFGKRLSVSKEITKKFDTERFSLKNLNKVKVREKNQLKIWNSLAALSNLNDSRDTNRTWENITQSI